MAEPVHVQSGYLFGQTNVQIASTPKDTPVVLILAQATTDTAYGGNIATPIHTDSSNNTLNTFSTVSSYTTTSITDGSYHIYYYMTPSRYAINTAAGDKLTLPGNSTVPVFWALWRLDGCDAQRSLSNSNAPVTSPALIAGTAFAATMTANSSNDVYQRKGTLIGCAVADNGSAQASPLSFSLRQWNPGGSGTIVNSGSQWVTDANNRFYFVSVGKGVTTQSSNWISNYSFTKSSNSSLGAGRCTYTRITEYRTEETQKARTMLAAVGRSSRY